MSMAVHNTQHDVIAIGDTTQDIFLKMTDASLQCDMDGKNCRLCFDYAEKIGVEQKTDIPAVGNAANHAVGIARLGLRSAVYTIVGDDDQGHKAQRVFEENNVDTRYVMFDKERGTNLSVVINFKGERTIFVYHEPRSYRLPDLDPTAWIYLTSASGGGVEQLQQQVLHYLEHNPQVQLAFNPGTFQIRLGQKALESLLRRTHILFLNREESARILETKTTEIEELVRGFHQLGVKIMIITDGPKGSYVSDGSRVLYADIFEGPVVERTGAGDAYGSGFLAAVIKGKDWSEAMMWGNANSTSVVQEIGARAGLLSEDALLALIKENSQVSPKVFANL